jgi:hypothetical protein
MTKVHWEHPAPCLFLLQASDAMKQYRKEHGGYTDEWTELDITFATEPYQLGEPGTYPTPTDRHTWRPKGSTLNYRIVRASDNSFLVEGYDAAGRPRYRITQDMDFPMALAPD